MSKICGYAYQAITPHCLSSEKDFITLVDKWERLQVRGRNYVHKNICIVWKHTFDSRNQVDVYACIHTYTFMHISIINGWHAKLTFLKKWGSIDLISYLDYFWSLDHPQTKSGHLIQSTSNKRNGHKSRCSELISGTKALQFVTFWKFLSFTENAGEHRSKGINHIYGVQIWWSEWSQTTIFHSWT